MVDGARFREAHTAMGDAIEAFAAAARTHLNGHA
jgi:hypothetical protein